MGWIECKTRLPNLEEPVLATDGENILIAELWELSGENQWVDSVEYRRAYSITHWSYLPDLPSV